MRAKQVITACAVAALAVGATSAGVVRAAAGKQETLIYAVYPGQDRAGEVFKMMQQNQHSTGERIEAYAVVSMDMKGKVRVRDQRKTDAGIGAAVGAVIGLVGGPVGSAIGATTGGAVGYLTGEAVGIPRDRVNEMKASLTPDSSALVVVLDDQWVKNVERDLNQADARSVIASEIGSSR